jgi:hypothetical protein
VVLVDSTVWIDLLRRRQTLAARVLDRLIDLGEAAVTPVIVQEILQGAVDKNAFERLAARFLALPMLGVTEPVALHVAAARLYAHARWQGVTPRSPHDCLIAATAVQADVLLLHDDCDFEALAVVEPRLRLVPLG